MLLQSAKFLDVLASIDVSDTSVGQQSADSASASVNLEVHELAWKCDFRASVETNCEWSWSVDFGSFGVMSTCEVLLQVSIALHAIPESLEFRIDLERLVCQMHGKVDVLKENEICNTWLGAHKVESTVIEQLTDNVKAFHDPDNSISAVTLAFHAGNDCINERLTCKSLELMASCLLLRSCTDKLRAVLLCDVVMNSVSL